MQSPEKFSYVASVFDCLLDDYFVFIFWFDFFCSCYIVKFELSKKQKKGPVRESNPGPLAP